MKTRDVLTLRDLTRADLDEVLSLAATLKQERGQGRLRPLLAGKKLGLVFQKPSLRTRATFDIGMTELGGSTLFLGPDEVQMGARETPADCVRVLEPAWWRSWRCGPSPRRSWRRWPVSAPCR